jgi:TonB family protein
MNAAALKIDGPGSFRRPVLPWAGTAADDRRFRRILQVCLALALAWALVLPWLKVRLADRQAPPAPLPPPMARLLLERPVPPLPPPSPRPESDKPEARPADAPPQVAKPLQRAPAPPSARQPVEGRPPGEVALEQARRKAASSGVLALKDELAALTAAPAAAQWARADAPPAPGVGTTQGAGAGAGSETGEPVRALITANAGRSSGGIGNAAYSRDSGGGGLAGRATTLLAGGGGGLGGGGGGGPGGLVGGRGTGNGNGAADAGRLPVPSAAKAGRAARSIEDIKLVFERQKGAIYALYNRALRDDPALQGKVVLELKIAPSGAVEALRIVSSELKSDELERKLLARIRQFDFGAKDVEAMVITWPVDFLPS